MTTVKSSLTYQKTFHVLSKIFLGCRQKNSEARIDKLQFSCFRSTFGKILPVLDHRLVPFGPIWTNFTCLRQKFVQIGSKVGLKQETCTFPFRTSAFSCRRLKNFFECGNNQKSSIKSCKIYKNGINSSRLNSQLNRNMQVFFITARHLGLGTCSSHRGHDQKSSVKSYT